MKRLIPVLILVAVLAAYFYGRPHASKQLTYSGVVEALTYDQGFELAGTIVEMPVKEGVRVTRKTLLARLDPAAWQAAEAQAVARLANARAKLQEAINGPRRPEIEEARARTQQSQADLTQALNGSTRPELQAARATMQAARQRYLMLADGYRKEDVDTGDRQLEAARINLTTLDTDYQRYVQLHKEGAVPDQLLETRKNQYLQALRAFQAAQDNVHKLKVGPRTEEKRAALHDYRSAQARYQDLLNGTRPEIIQKNRAQLLEHQQALKLMQEGTRPEEIQVARQEVAEALAALDQAKVNLSHTRLLAGADGMVVTRNFEPGDVVAAQASVITLDDLDHPWVYIYIPEPELSKVRLNAPAQIRVDSLPGQILKGQVIRIYEKAEFTPKYIQTTGERVNLVFRAKVAVENPDLRLRPGMPADVEVRTMISVSKLVHRFGAVEALRGIDLEIPEGEVFGLVGPDGAGKTTLIKIVAGLIRPSYGEVKLGEGGPAPRYGYIPQRFSLYRDLTVEENIDFFARLYGLKNYQSRKQELLESIGLANFRARLAEQLSGGMKQKLTLLCTLIHSPKLLLMDEPTTGVDPVSRREFWGIVFSLQRQGLTVLAATPYMDEAEQFDRVALMHQGRFLRVGTTAQIKESVPGRVVEVLCPRPVEVRTLLSGEGLEVELFGDKVHVFVADESAIPGLRSSLERGKVSFEELRAVPYSIEDVFLKVAT